MLQSLLNTKDAILVEGNPHDKIWAVGLKDTDPLIMNPKNWKGTNWLGEVLMGVRLALGGLKPNTGKYNHIKIYQSEIVKK